MRSPLALLGASVLALGLLTACGADADDAPDLRGHHNEPSEATRTGSPEDEADGGTGGLTQRPVTTDLTSPWGVVLLDDGDVLVSERDTGRILRVDAASGDQQELRTLDDVVPGGEAGLLGIAMDADRSTLFAYYTLAESSRIVAMTWDGEALGEPETIFAGIPGGAGYHQGGRIVVGPDDLLYVGTGDNGVPANAQDRDSLSGKVLRLTQDGDPAPGNPFGTAVYSLGHRNIEGLAFDEDGRLWEAEFGDAAYDEVNLIEAGQNYGWPEVEGSGGGSDYVDPKVVWRTSDASPSGIAVWDGSLWVAALRGNRLWEVPLDGAEVGDPVAHLTGDLGRLRTPYAGPDGLLLTTSNTDGRGDPRDADDRLLELTRAG